MNFMTIEYVFPEANNVIFDIKDVFYLCFDIYKQIFIYRMLIRNKSYINLMNIMLAAPYIPLNEPYFTEWEKFCCSSRI
jgi:hypothetical protein